MATSKLLLIAILSLSIGSLTRSSDFDVEQDVETIYGDLLGENLERFHKLCILERLNYIRLFDEPNIQRGELLLDHMNDLIDVRSKLGAQLRRKCPAGIERQLPLDEDQSKLLEAMQDQCQQELKHEILCKLAKDWSWEEMEARQPVKRWVCGSYEIFESARGKLAAQISEIVASNNWFEQTFYDKPYKCSRSASSIFLPYFQVDAPDLLASLTNEDAQEALATAERLKNSEANFSVSQKELTMEIVTLKDKLIKAYEQFLAQRSPNDEADEIIVEQKEEIHSRQQQQQTASGQKKKPSQVSEEQKRQEKDREAKCKESRVMKKRGFMDKLLCRGYEYVYQV